MPGVHVLKLASGEVSAEVDLVNGGRLTSLLVGGAELLLIGDGSDPLLGGMYPMVPFAGRIRHGRFSFAGKTYELPQTLGDHAIHGYGHVSEWTTDGENSIRWDFAEPWPFGGYVTQHFDVQENSVTVTMTAHVEEPQPIQLGWHPWFARENSAGSLAMRFSPGQMFERDVDGMPGERVSVRPGPFDDCFTEVAQPLELVWGSLVAELTSTVDYWVVYDEPETAVCVEPQSGPPNAINSGPEIVTPDTPLRIRFQMSFRHETNPLNGR